MFHALPLHGHVFSPGHFAASTSEHPNLDSAIADEDTFAIGVKYWLVSLESSVQWTYMIIPRLSLFRQSCQGNTGLGLVSRVAAHHIMSSEAIG